MITRRTLTNILMSGAGFGLLSKAFAQSAGADHSHEQPQSEKGAPVTRLVADFIVSTRFTDIPENVLELSRKSILDGLGLALCGSVAKSGEIVRGYLEAQGLTAKPSNGATVIGSQLKAPARFAAFANAIGIHADDYDDTQLAVAQDRVYGLLTHPTAPVLPAALAIAEIGSMSGKDLLLAYNIGVEVECKIAEAIAPRHYEDGFHSTGTIGVLGASAATARLYGCDVAHVLTALGIGASEAAGLRENFGTMTKPFHAGRAAESGVVAADFAKWGWTATDKILEAPRGFFQAAGGGFDKNAIVGKLGNPWTFESPGVSIKPFPSGSLSHPGMTEMLRLIKEYDIKPEQVDSVKVGVNRNSVNALIHHRPTDNLQAKFSMEFCISALLLYRKAGLDIFTDEVVNRPVVQEMIRRVQFGIDPAAEASGYNKMTTIIDVKLKDGRVVSGRTDIAKGNPADPMAFDEVAAKFLDCARFAKWPETKATHVVDTVRQLEKMSNVQVLTALLAS